MLAQPRGVLERLVASALRAQERRVSTVLCQGQHVCVYHQVEPMAHDTSMTPARCNLIDPTRVTAALPRARTATSRHTTPSHAHAVIT